jgi:hypothetical protein
VLELNDRDWEAMIPGIRRRWEDRLGAALGLLVGATPWLAGDTGDENIVLHAAQLGLLILGLASFGLVQPNRWEEIGLLACGLALAASILGYAHVGNLGSWHVALGLGVMLLALLEMWQEWQITTQQMNRARRRGISNRR